MPVVCTTAAAVSDVVVSAAGLYLVQCRKFRDQLVAAAEAAMHHLLDFVCTATRESNLKVFEQYQVCLSLTHPPWSWVNTTGQQLGLNTGRDMHNNPNYVLSNHRLKHVVTTYLLLQMMSFWNLRKHLSLPGAVGVQFQQHHNDTVSVYAAPRP